MERKQIRPSLSTLFHLSTDLNTLLCGHYQPRHWVTERGWFKNINPYYKPLIESQRRHRHLFWSNFDLPDVALQTTPIRNASIGDLQRSYGFDLSKYKIPNKRQALRNCVHPELGKAILSTVEQLISTPVKC